MGIGKFELSDKQRRIIFAVAILLVSAAFIPYISDFVAGILNWNIGNSNFTIGTIFAIMAAYAAYLILPQPFGPRSL